jgi:hypothetical protein
VQPLAEHFASGPMWVILDISSVRQALPLFIQLQT